MLLVTQGLAYSKSRMLHVAVQPKIISRFLIWSNLTLSTFGTKQVQGIKVEMTFYVDLEKYTCVCPPVSKTMSTHTHTCTAILQDGYFLKSQKLLVAHSFFLCLHILEHFIPRNSKKPQNDLEFQMKKRKDNNKTQIATHMLQTL